MNIDAVKSVIRCRDLVVSKRFYTEILEMALVEEWDQEEGKGLIVTSKGCAGYIELSESQAAEGPGERVELQLRCPSLSACIRRLADRWEFEGPVERPWGHNYIWLRDPDNLRIAIYEDVRPPRVY